MIRWASSASRGRHQQHLRATVGDDVADLGRVQVAIDRGDVEAGTQCRPVDHEHLRDIVRQHGDDVAPAQADVMKRGREPRGAVLQLTEGQGRAATGHDDRRPLRG